MAAVFGEAAKNNYQVPRNENNNNSSQLQQNTVGTAGEIPIAESNTDIAETTSAESTTADIAGNHRAASNPTDRERSQEPGYETWRSQNTMNLAAAAISSAPSLRSPHPNNNNNNSDSHHHRPRSLPLLDNNSCQQTIFQPSLEESNSDRPSELVPGQLNIPQMNNGEHVISNSAPVTPNNGGLCLHKQTSVPARMGT